MFSILRVMSIILAFSSPAAVAATVPISTFPMENYNQSVDYWINAKNFPNYDQSLLTDQLQQQYMQDFRQHWLNPWNSQYVNLVFAQNEPSIDSLEREILSEFDNQGKTPEQANYAENFRPYSEAWIEAIKANISLDALGNLTYDPVNRAILIKNTEARALPTNEVSFYQFTQPGQGYPFDNLQVSALWAGTPAYIIGVSKDKSWTMVLTPAVIGWVPSAAVAKAKESFVKVWTKVANNKMAAIIHTKTPFKGNARNFFSFNAYVGSVFPVMNFMNKEALIFPIRGMNGMAHIAYETMPEDEVVIMPYASTPHHFANIMKTLIGRPYGWGGMYFYNDCSQELRSLYAPFGIWLPRHSSNQVTVGNMIDKTSLSTEDRINYLMKSGHPLMTIVYIGGHVFQYVGNFVNPNQPNQEKMALIYQNVWGLSPSDRSRRAVIGESVLFPLLDQYPEDASLASLASKHYFQVAYLDEPKPKAYELLQAKPKVDLRSLMMP